MRGGCCAAATTAAGGFATVVAAVGVVRVRTETTVEWGRWGEGRGLVLKR